jgi:transcription initiation factor IIF auxiliary subunit
MDMHIEQDFKYQGDDTWKWSVWLEAEEEELNEVECVTYILHHTFPKPIRQVTDRQTKFRLDCSGWGVFVIHAKVKLKDEDEDEAIHLKHHLRLEYPDGQEATL